MTSTHRAATAGQARPLTPGGRGSLLSLAVGIGILLHGVPAEGCTIFAVAGEPAGGRVFLAKNRDRRVRFKQVFADVRPADGHRYLGIASEENGRITSGVNEKGVAVVTASASTRREKGMVLLDQVLAKAATVQDAISILSAMPRRSPWILMVADSTEAAVLEAAPDRPLAIRRTSSGVLVHTNHYVTPELVNYNSRSPGRSSLTRLARAQALLAGLASHRAITEEALMGVCRDHTSGPSELSICRHPEVDGKTGGTISSAVYVLEKGKLPRMLVALGQPCVSPFVQVSFDRPVSHVLRGLRSWYVNELRRAQEGPTPRPGARLTEEDY